MTRILALATLAMVGLKAAELKLIDAGRSNYVIVTPARPAAPEAFAASELQRYLERMTGVRLPVVGEAAWKGQPGISVGRTAAAVKSAATPKPRYAEDDAFSVRVRGSNLFIAGSNPRGTLSAAYEFLKGLGFRWFAPGYKFYRGLNETVPKSRTAAVDDALNTVVQPAFRIRGEYPEHYYNFEPDDILALLDWCAKNHVNYVGFRQNELSDAWYRVLEPEARKRGTIIGAAGHGYERFLPRDRWFREHPEWYALSGGARSDRYFDQFCTSNPDAIAAFRKGLAAFVRSYPGLSFLSAMPNDSPRWCQCDRCQAEKISSRDRLFRMNELISKTVYEVNPRMKVEIGAGSAYFGVAAGEHFQSPYPNMIYRSGVLRRCLRHAWNDPECATNRPQYETSAGLTKKIRAAGGNVIWTSRYSSFREQSIPGILYPAQMAGELRDLKKLDGLGVLYNYSTPADWIPYELKHYLYASLLVDPDRALEPFLAAYFKDRFPGSPADVAAHYTALRRAMERYDHPGGGYTRENAFGLYPAPQFAEGERDFAEAQAAIERAQKSNPNRDERQLIWLLKASLEYGRGRWDIDRLSQAGRREEAQARAAKLVDFVEKLDGRGIFYDSVFARRGLEYRFGPPPRGELMKKRPLFGTRIYEYLGVDPDEDTRVPAGKKR